MISKDDETLSLAKKYLQRLDQKKKSLGKMASLKANPSNLQRVQNLKKKKTHELSQQTDKREQ